MSPQDRNGNRYLINFVNHSSNYLRVLMAKNKVEATKKFEHFLVFLRSSTTAASVLRTDGGGEYKNVEDFCQATGVRRQVSEANNQTLNGKADRMHRTILNMARCMLFASGLPLKFWGHAVEYAAYVTQQEPVERQSETPVAAGDADGQAVGPDGHRDIRQPVYDPGKKAWAPRTEVGMIVGKNDETKGFKVYIPKDMVVVTTQQSRTLRRSTWSRTCSYRRSSSARTPSSGRR
ncbi:hypothetical protein PF003_g29666 [Phytophthora fragariae]|nr:hypothetical protein PF003_g29666 [Phytophthora fragariae]